MLPGRLDIEVWRGSTYDLKFKLQTIPVEGENPVPIPFDDIRLSVSHRGQLIFRKTFSGGDLMYDPDWDEDYDPPFRARFEPNDTRDLPRYEEGRNYTPPRYEIEVWVSGRQMPWLWGEITALGGDNDD